MELASEKLPGECSVRNIQKCKTVFGEKCTQAERSTTFRSECTATDEEKCRTVFDTQQEKQCEPVQKRKCSVVNDQQCTEVFEKECAVVYEDKQEQHCRPVPDQECQAVSNTVYETVE